jgi:hypothetical protein
MQDKELKPAEQTQNTTTPALDQSRVGSGGPMISGVHRELSDADLGNVAGGPRMTNDVSTITDLADEDLRQVSGGQTGNNSELS